MRITAVTGYEARQVGHRPVARVAGLPGLAGRGYRVHVRLPILRTILAPLVTSALLALFPSASTQPFYVNMIDNRTGGPYQLGRFLRGAASPAGPIARARCDLWGPSAVRVGGGVRLYAAEHDCRGWHRVVRLVSRDGRKFGPARLVLRTTDELRMPTVVRDRNVYHLWYSADRGGLARVLIHASSRDGIHFSRFREVLAADDLTSISVASVFRDGGRWRMFVQGYSRDVNRAYPYLVTFGSPGSGRYRIVGRVRTDRPTPKIDASWVCRSARGYRGLFTLYGDTDPARHGWEWTAPFRSRSLLGPWRVAGNSLPPALPLMAGTPKTSVENPTRPVATARIERC
jgi:hypothetical protein